MPIADFISAFLVIIADQVRQHFRVRAGPEFVAGGDKFVPQRVVILHHAVVDDGNPAGLVQVRMRIDI